jgi:serine/threonine-protein kinase
MEDSQGKQENEQTTGETQLDTVDYNRLARLSAGSEQARAGDEAPPPRSARAYKRSPDVPAAQSPGTTQTNPHNAVRAVQAAAPKKTSTPAIAVIVAIITILLLSVGLGIYSFLKMPRAQTPMTGNQPNQGANKNTQPNAVKADMVAIKGGTFQMGRSDGAEQEGPPHSVTVGAFYIDRTEVTNTEYAQFIQETGHAAPGHFINGKPANGIEQWPVTNVTLDDAKAFAAWRSKRDGVTYRLPTEEEWEYAARDGSQGTIFTWGNAWADGKANVNATHLKPVGTSPDDKTKAGVVDMIGNAYEWTSSKPSYYPGSKLQVDSGQSGWIVIRGGAYITDTSKKKISATYRDWIPPSTVNSALGFRLVK